MEVNMSTMAAVSQLEVSGGEESSAVNLTLKEAQLEVSLWGDGHIQVWDERTGVMLCEGELALLLKLAE
jgi:hypothetical protein